MGFRRGATRAGGFVAGCLLLQLVAGSPGRAAEAGENAARPFRGDRPYWRTDVFRRVLSDQRFLVRHWWPAELHRPSFAAPLAGALAAALNPGSTAEPGIDLKTAHWAHGTRGATSPLWRDLTKLGNGAPIVAALGLTYLGARHAHDDRLAASASLGGEALVDAGIWIVGLKRVFARARPNRQNEGRFFQYGAADTGSFPSGHAMGAFAVATVFADTWRDKRWVRWTAYGGASLVAVSRLHRGQHFPSDLLAGAILGNSIGHMVTARSEESGDRERRLRRHLTPIVSPDGTGLGIGLDLSH